MSNGRVTISGWERQNMKEKQLWNVYIVKYISPSDHGELALVSLPCNMIQFMFMLVQASIRFHNQNGFVEMRGNQNLLHNT